MKHKLSITAYYWTSHGGQYYTTISFGGYYYILEGENSDDDIHDFMELIFDFNYKDGEGRYTREEWLEIDASIYYEYELLTRYSIH